MLHESVNGVGPGFFHPCRNSILWPNEILCDVPVNETGKSAVLAAASSVEAWPPLLGGGRGTLRPRTLPLPI